MNYPTAIWSQFQMITGEYRWPDGGALLLEVLYLFTFSLIMFFILFNVFTMTLSGYPDPAPDMQRFLRIVRGRVACPLRHISQRW